ncbi:cilia- and flagella-associated protein 206-like isoform X2 [Sipha flava]|uniref:Cilia- and flagella-associated protein 206 n=1 Tax=Sipha flava TaxID=143950 RepID=A0A8B8GQQ4_9HEMI|nr:cilia- and flagella-associated protein 206-like isoform X2 [Sipha flava]
MIGFANERIVFGTKKRSKKKKKNPTSCTVHRVRGQCNFLSIAFDGNWIRVCVRTETVLLWKSLCRVRTTNTLLYERILLTRDELRIADMSQRVASVRAVIEGCAERGVQVSEELASVFYNCCTLKPRADTGSARKTSEMTITADAIKRCIDRLCVRDDPAIACVKMQLLLEHDYRNREFVINSVNEDFDRRTEPILNEILENLRTLQCDENNVYYTRLVQYVILVNYIGDPTAPECLQKTSGVLNGVVDRYGPPGFGEDDRSPRSRTERLKEIASLACAVTLHGADRSDCREGIFDRETFLRLAVDANTEHRLTVVRFSVVDNLPDAADALVREIDLESDDSRKTATALASRIRRFYKVDEDFSGPLFAVRVRLADMGTDELNGLKAVLAFHLQRVKNLETMKKDICEYKDDLLTTFHNYNLTLTRIRNNFQTIDDIDDIIYPQLIDLSTTWSEIIDITNYLSTTASFVSTMKQMKNEVINVERIRILPAPDMIPNINANEQRKIIKTHSLHPTCKLYPSSCNAIDRRNLFADGYCVVMFVETGGTLIKHDKNVCIIKCSDKWFSFSCIQAALTFGANPSYYLNGFYNLLRSEAHLLFFFHLYEQIADKQYISNERMRGKYRDILEQIVLEPYDNTTTNGSIPNTNEIKKCNLQLGYTSNMVTRSTQTQDVYKSVQIQTGLCKVGYHTSEKSTSTNPLIDL